MNLLSPDTLQRFRRNGKVIIINPDVPAWIVTNDIGDLIISLFDGESSNDEIIDFATQAIGEQHRNAIRQFVVRIAQSRLFLSRNDCEHHRMPLANVHLSLTNHCNLHCKYCYAAERKESSETLMTLDDYRNVIAQICQINPDVGFTLTGGEPLLNRNVLEIAEMIKQRGNNIMLLSNGTLLTEDLCKRFKGLIDLITISIDGTDRESHGRTRGDNYDQVIRAVDLLDRFGIDYTLSMTVTRLNLDQVEPMAKRYGSRLNFAPLFPVSDKANAELSITGEEYYRVLKGAAGVNPLGYCESSLNAAKLSPCLKCAIADGEFSIAPNGDVYPCQLLHDTRFLCGNVKTESVESVYNRSQMMKQIRSTTVDDIPKCKACAIKYICGGACRARNFYETGDLYNVGDFCKYEFEAYLDGISTIYSHDIIEP